MKPTLQKKPFNKISERLGNPKRLTAARSSQYMLLEHSHYKLVLTGTPSCFFAKRRIFIKRTLKRSVSQKRLVSTSRDGDSE